MTSRMGAALVVSLSLAGACRSSAPLQKSGVLPPGVIATVGSDRVDRESVERIASAQGVGVEAARDKAVFDALLAAAARERFGPALSAQARKSAAARVLLQELSRRASDQGPPTDAEVAEATERRFWELDRPPLLRTTHAIVLTGDQVDDARSRALAERIHAAVTTTRDPASFRQAVGTVPTGGLEVRVEDLDPVARDGRALDPAKPPPPGSTVAHFAEEYVAAAFAIPELGAKSPVVKSKFGYHVILAVERIPEKRTPLEERRRLLAPEILAARAEKLRDEVLASVRKTMPIEIERAAMDLTEKVKALQ